MHDFSLTVMVTAHVLVPFLSSSNAACTTPGPPTTAPPEVRGKDKNSTGKKIASRSSIKMKGYTYESDIIFGELHMPIFDLCTKVLLMIEEG